MNSQEPMAASPPPWTKQLDLKLIRAIQDFLGTELYDAEKTKIDWQKVFKTNTWPSGFSRETLKSRWVDSYRRWAVGDAPRNHGNRATLICFSDLRRYVEARTFSFPSPC